VYVPAVRALTKYLDDDDDDDDDLLQVGTYDPFSDDPQLGVQKMVLCCASETLCVGGTAGQVVVLQFEQQEQEVDIKVVSCATFHYILLHISFFIKPMPQSGGFMQ